MTREADPTTDRPTETDERPGTAAPTFQADAVFDPETYLPTVEAALPEERTEREVAFLAERFDEDADLLDAPCGHGRHAGRLAERGYEVAGLDRSRPFLDRARADARERGVADRVDYRQGDLRSLPYADDAFDGVYNLFTSFGFFEDADNRRVLSEFARVLRPGGRLVMEMAHRDGVLYDYREAGVTRTEAGTVVEERSFDPLTGRNRSERLTVLASDADPEDHRRVQESTYEVRLYSFTELRWLLSEAGFEVREAYGGTDESDLTVASTRMAVVAELT